MAMRSNGLLPLCLLLCLLGHLGRSHALNCDSLTDVSEIFQNCVQVPWVHLMSEYGFKSSLSRTDIMDILTSYCSSVRPELLSCFRTAVSLCHNSRNLISLAEGTGGFCEGRTVAKWVTGVLPEGMGPVVYTGDCYVALLSDIHRDCRVKHLSTISKAFEEASLDNIRALSQRYWEKYVQCAIRRLDAEPGCSPATNRAMFLMERALPPSFAMTATHSVALALSVPAA